MPVCLRRRRIILAKMPLFVCVGGNGCARFCALLVGFGVGPKATFRIEHPPPPAQKLQAHNFAYIYFRKKKGEKKWQQLFFPPLEGRDLRKAFFLKKKGSFLGGKNWPQNYSFVRKFANLCEIIFWGF